jgi:hypothetical protein
MTIGAAAVHVEGRDSSQGSVSQASWCGAEMGAHTACSKVAAGHQAVAPARPRPGVQPGEGGTAHVWGTVGWPRA